MNHSGGGITNREEYIRYLTKVRNFGDFEKLPSNGQAEYKTLENMTEFEYNDFNETEFKRNWYFNMYVDFKITENIDRRDYAKNFIDKQLIYGNTVALLDTGLDVKKANTVIKGDFKDTKQIRKVAHAHALDNALDINDTQKDGIQKKMMTVNSGITESEQLEYKKSVLNSVYNMREPAVGFEWYNILDDKTRMNQFANLKPFTNRGSLQECLATVVQQEHRAEIKRRQEVKDQEHGIMGAVDNETAIIRSLVCTKYKSVKMTMLVSWLEALGFTSLHDDHIITAVDLKTRLTLIHKAYLADASDVCSVLGKKKYKMKTIEKLKPDDAKFVFSMLKFINGTLDATWGLKVVGVKTDHESKRKTKPTEFRLVNQNVDRGIFNNPMIETVLMFGRYTPVLGIIHDGDEDLSDDEVLIIDTEDLSEHDSEQKLEFLRMLDSNQV